ncbi:tyrosine-type recombinase/integrase [Candidatus Woesearchaeota archaeon]|jgi:integrase/recombinase XerD|nr:tyrosine-type recombinase/integrase [Candidatus Woesearchaeota archaeon]MBT5396878.1 tyrosine-type recombinase/integrase [Candidatus Woesearchaeota archaeon]MBT5924211.1 tyrosine-type recombinase/integrase [Candidatus Woesearchaeota archaeon]MBT7762376.1 tyrosine-type recombinase/integrase [Candidatus Woesearchaeota archaeon]
MDVTGLVKREALRRGLSPRTVDTYCSCLGKFFRVVQRDPKELTKKDILKYIDTLIERKAPGSTINVYLNSLKFFYEKVLKKKLTVNLQFSKKRKHLPTFLTKEEIETFFHAIDNKKHLLMITLLYSAGLRVSELVQLKAEDFDFRNNCGWVRAGKGNKDRFFILSMGLKDTLFNWIQHNNIMYNEYVFSSRNGHYSIKSIQEIIKKATKIAGINKNVHPHTLRHSFATHLIQNGNSVFEVQQLLGHNSVNTTMIYVHMASPNLLKIQSPYDSLRIKKKV